MAFQTEKTFHRDGRIAHVSIGQHFEVPGKGKGHAVSLGRKYVEVLIYGGKRVKICPLEVSPLDTHHT